MASIQQSLNQSLYQLSLLKQLKKSSPESLKAARIQSGQEKSTRLSEELEQIRGEVEAGGGTISETQAGRISSILKGQEETQRQLFGEDPAFAENLESARQDVDLFKEQGRLGYGEWEGFRVEQEGLNRLNNTLTTKTNQKNAMNERKDILNQYGEVINKDGNQ